MDSKYVGFQTSQTEVKSRKLTVNSKSDSREGKILVLKMPLKSLNKIS